LLNPNDATRRYVEFKHGFTKGTADPAFIDYVIMDEMGWSYQDLNETPIRQYLEIMLILKAKNSVRKKQDNKMKSK